MHLLLITALIMQVYALEADAICFPTVTTASGTYAPKGKICSGDLIFEENFNELNLEKWQHEQTLAGGGNWEFQWYTNNRSISYVENSTLHIKPHLLVDHMGDPNFIYRGHLDINGGTPADECTNPSFWGCLRDGAPNIALNPVVSARMRTVNSFNYKYGRFEARARIPAGDWLWPAIWMLPKLNQYASWPSSGEIDIMESRGNKDLVQGDKNIGTKLVGSTIHWGTNFRSGYHRYIHNEKYDPKGFDTEFHKYQFEWTPTSITFSVDDEKIGRIVPPSGGFWYLGKFGNVDNPWRGATKMAPFDQEFYIILNLACGGVSYFPDDAKNPGGKPWKNTSPQASKDFWEGRNEWLPTWQRNTDTTHFLIDYVRVWAL